MSKHSATRRTATVAALLAVLALLAPASLATAAPSRTITDLGTLGGDTSSANAINNSGQVVGSSRTASGGLDAFL
jgi:hypothetical protein